MERSESARCNTCKAITTWSGTGRRLHCSGCGTDFPCARECRHWDCMEATGRAVVDASGVLRVVSNGQAHRTTELEKPVAGSDRDQVDQVDVDAA
jgi:hypothetical protein